MDIQSIINEQLELFSRLDRILDDEKELLIKDRAKELADIIEKKKELAGKIALIEKKRIEIYGDKKSEDFVSEGKITKEDIDRLKTIIFEIKEKDETNLALTKQSLNYIRTITSALNPNQKIVTYGNSGKIGDPSSKGVFTTKV